MFELQFELYLGKNDFIMPRQIAVATYCGKKYLFGLCIYTEVIIYYCYFCFSSEI